jgi:SMC interacting uncharacterized protein involved in chromosome segregation
MPRKKKPNLQQQKTIKKERELIALNKKADEFRQLLNKENIPPIDIKESIVDKIDLKNCLYSI